MKPPRVSRLPLLQGSPPAMRLMGIGLYFALCVVGGIGGGVFLDNELGSRPILTLIGLALGLIAALFGGFVELREVLADVARQGKSGP